MFTITNNFIRINQDLFKVLKTFKEESVKSVDPIKEWLSAESVFKKDGVLYFCEKIQDLETITDQEIQPTT